MVFFGGVNRVGAIFLGDEWWLLFKGGNAIREFQGGSNKMGKVHVKVRGQKKHSGAMAFIMNTGLQTHRIFQKPSTAQIR